MPDEPVSRREFEGYLRRHETDPEAHGTFRRLDRQAQSQDQRELDKRVSDLERFQQRLMGGFLVLAAFVGSGVATIFAVKVFG